MGMLCWGLTTLWRSFVKVGILSFIRFMVNAHPYLTVISRMILAKELNLSNKFSQL